MMQNGLACLALFLTSNIPVLAQDASRRAAATERAMTDAERTVLTIGIMPVPFGPDPIPIPAEALPGAGYVAGIPRLGVPSLAATDASLGVSYIAGLGKDSAGATALPSGMAQGSTWNPELIRASGAMIGSEARAKGFNVMLAGGANLVRDPRAGRTFEYLSEDPLLAGTLVGASIAGIQSNRIISTIKHFAFNNQETGRSILDARIGDANARESDLLAFQIGIEIGQPGAVMCAYNRINRAFGCDNDHLLNTVLKRDWGYKGFVMSDWGASIGTASALHGQDHQSGSQLDPEMYFGKPLADAAARDPAYRARIADMNRRVLHAIYANGVSAPGAKSPIDFTRDGDVAKAVAQEGIVLLRNRNDALPLLTSAKSVAVIGGYASTGVLSGGGSSQVQGEGGPALIAPSGADGPWAAFITMQYHRSVPLAAMRARAPQTQFSYDDGRYAAKAAAAARKAEVAVVFATQWMTEGLDVPDLSLPNGQDALIEAVSGANPHTIVVLETGGPVVMPWLDKTAAVLEAWYPGARGGEAIAAVLYGDVNPSGRLPVTFPASTAQLPHPVLPGSDTIADDLEGRGKPGQSLTVDYNVEGADVGYRWFARTNAMPAFAFGHGLSYTSFACSDLRVTAGSVVKANFTIRNTGGRDGAEVAQLYLVNMAGKPIKRLVGFAKIPLRAGESRNVTIGVDARLLADWEGSGWLIAAGRYDFALGRSADDLGAVVPVRMGERRLKP